MGIRVALPTAKKGKVNAPSLFLVQFLKFSRTFLETIGKPFYIFLTWAFVGLFTILWFLGSGILKVAKIIVNTAPKFEARGKSTTDYGLPTTAKRNFSPSLSLSLVTNHLSLPSHLSLRAKLALVLILFAIGVGATWFVVLKDLPEPGTLTTRNQAISTKIYDRNGILLYKIYKNQNRTLVPLDQIPKYTQDATIAIEDSGFYSHPGFSVRGISRAIYRNTTRGQKTGGSTITQQLVKNTLLSPEKTVLRKVKEIVLAIQVEMTFSKEQILEMYLNEVSYGGSYYGIEEASVGYFGKSARDLNLAESTILAGLPKAPTTFSPYGAHPEKTRDRQLEVLAQMVQQGYITGHEADMAANDEIVFAPQRTDIKAPHFVMYVRQYLAEKYGEDVVEQGGLEVYTTLDLELQEKVQDIVAAEISKIRRMNISNGASLVTNPATGEVLAMVGSYDYWNQEDDGNVNVTVAERQPGSSIKPVNYSYAIENKKYTAASLIADTPITYRARGAEPYTPHNYNNSYRGNVTLRSALGSSLNIPAVKVLASYGVDKMIYQGQKLGITTWVDPRRYGLSLTLGGGEVKMTDMNVVYGSFANYGQRVDLNPVLWATNYKGQVVEENSCALQGQTVEIKKGNPGFRFLSIFENLVPTAHASEAFNENNCGTYALDARAAYIITDILKDNVARTPTFGPASQLVIQNHPEVAVKTGTTQNLRDNWTIGYTQDYVVATWVGNNNNEPMSYVASGVTGASPIWHNIMTYLLEDKPSIAWSEPEEIVKLAICPNTGTLPCEGCGSRPEFFLPETQPKLRCVPKSPEDQAKEQNQTNLVL